jgi:DNA primase
MKGDEQCMFEEIKEQLIDNPEHIVNLLELYGCEKIRIRNKEIRCAREDGANPTAVVIRLTNNEKLYVKDYEVNFSGDLINYFVQIKGVPFRDVMNAVKHELNIDSIYNYKRRTQLFGGIYSSIGRHSDEISVTTYPDEILQQYGNTPNLMWLKDSISFETQRKWSVGFDVFTQRATLPIRTPSGEIMAIKGRFNGEPDEFVPKYLYIVEGAMSQTLFGYSENYNMLYEGNIIIVESEKSVLKLDSWGYNNVVALGSNSLSSAQAKLILSLNPKSVTFMLDKNLPFSNTKRNADLLKSFCVMKELDIRYWNWQENLTLPPKSAPCDATVDEWHSVLANEIEDIERIKIEE